ncbi:MAG: polysaccharide deacetylase family protein [Gammaproteobacteria bacterium]
MNARIVPVLMYHHVTAEPGLVTVSPEHFEQQMRWLKTRGYHTVRADELLGFVRGEQALPARSVMITFDDGYLDNYVHAYPVLQKLGLHAVIFAVTRWIGNGATRPHAGQPGEPPATPGHKACKHAIAEGRADEVMLRWSEIVAMEAEGSIEVHSHTHSHVRWDREHADERERIQAVQNDLQRSHHELYEQLGRRSRHLCWPWGYFEPGYVPAAREAGFEALYTTARGLARKGSDPLAIPRIVVKDRGADWFGARMRLYTRPWLGPLYLRLRGA